MIDMKIAAQTIATYKLRDLTAAQIDSACTTYRRDFGLLDDAAKENLRMECREWWEAIRKEFNG